MTLSAIPYVVIALGLFGIIMIVFGFILDNFLDVDNGLMNTPGLPYSEERASTLNVLTLMFGAMPIVATLTGAIYLMTNAHQSISGEI